MSQNAHARVLIGLGHSVAVIDMDDSLKAEVEKYGVQLTFGNYALQRKLLPGEYLLTFTPAPGDPDVGGRIFERRLGSAISALAFPGEDGCINVLDYVETIEGRETREFFEELDKRLRGEVAEVTGINRLIVKVAPGGGGGNDADR